MVSLCWMLTGLLIGFAAAEVVIYVVISHDNKKVNNEEFVKELIEKKGWEGARWELETAFKGKYMRIWRRLYKKHIEEKDNGNN